MKGKYLITSDDWFFAPNGKQYKSAWGEIKILTDDFLGIKTNRNASNWFAKIGSYSNHIIMAGCQIHYAIKCETKPNNENVIDDITHDGKYCNSERPSRIYIAE